MKKDAGKKYESPKVGYILFRQEEIITTSGGNPEDPGVEMPYIPI